MMIATQARARIKRSPAQLWRVGDLLYGCKFRRVSGGGCGIGAKDGAINFTLNFVNDLLSLFLVVQLSLYDVARRKLRRKVQMQTAN